MKTTKLFFAMLACAALMIGCGDSGGGDGDPTPLAFADNAAYDIPASTVGTAITNINVAPGASGGKTPYTFSATGLPAGITVSTAGLISGTPTEVTAAGNATITVKDSGTPQQSKEITIAFGAVAVATYDITVTNDTHGTGEATVGGQTVTKVEEGAEVTLTAAPASGYVFWRWSVTSGSATLSDRYVSTTTFTMPAGAVTVKAEFTTVATTSVVINGETWAACNVDDFGTFAASPTSYGKFYQWNRSTAWLSTGEDPVSSPVGETWNSVNTGAEGDVWEAVNDPCPTGYRVPTQTQQATLLATANVTNEWTTHNGVNGCRFTDKTSGNTIFLPAAGSRYDFNGALGSAGGSGGFWSSTSSSTGRAYRLLFHSGGVIRDSHYRAYGSSVRCVLQ